MCALYLCVMGVHCAQSDPGGGLSKELKSHAVHGTEETVNTGPLSWLVMEGCSDSSLEASIASVSQKQTDCGGGRHHLEAIQRQTLFHFRDHIKHPLDCDL